jgi:hypothetical protein
MAESDKAASIHVAIQKVFQTMKAIVDGKKDQEFLEECLKLDNDRYVMVSPQIVRFVKHFVSKHELAENLPPDVHEKSEFSTAIARSAGNGETCF